MLQVTDELNARLARNGINVISNGLSYIDDGDAGSIITTIQVNTQCAGFLKLLYLHLHLIHGPKAFLGIFLFSIAMAFVTKYTVNPNRAAILY